MSFVGFFSATDWWIFCYFLSTNCLTLWRILQPTGETTVFFCVVDWQISCFSLWSIDKFRDFSCSWLKNFTIFSCDWLKNFAVSFKDHLKNVTIYFTVSDWWIFSFTWLTDKFHDIFVRTTKIMNDRIYNLFLMFDACISWFFFSCDQERKLIKRLHQKRQ